MTRESLRAGAITVESITGALTMARGDLFLAASALKITGRELDGYIRSSGELQVVATGIAKVRASPEYEQLSGEQFAQELARLSLIDKVEANGVIRELATMKFGKSAALADVKLRAALAMRGADNTAQDGHQPALLAELNAQYLLTAPRIKSVRAVAIEYHPD